MFCPQCGSARPEGAKFCPRCGAPVREGPPPITTELVVNPLSEPVAEPVPPPIAPAGGWTEPVVVRDPAADPLAGARYAGFWRRFWATCVDAFLLWILAAIVRVVLGLDLITGLPAAVSGDDEQDPFRLFTPQFVLATSVGWIASWLYSAFLESSKQQGTLGQQLLGYRVADKQGQRISFAIATARHFAQYLSALTFGIGYLMVLFTSRKQALHDLIVGTFMVRERDASR